MALIALPEKGLQRGNVGAVLAWSQLHLGQLRIAAAPPAEEYLLDAIRPGQGIEHADLAGQTG
jgi:hypothetical protein